VRASSVLKIIVFVRDSHPMTFLRSRFLTKVKATKFRNNRYEIVQNAVRYLQPSGVPDAEISADLLLRKAELLGADFNSLLQRRFNREPLQYLIGDWDFHNINVLVKQPVLIPRHETEQLVEIVLSSNNSPSCTILDVGTGTGAIGLALLHSKPSWECTALDKDILACELAQENALRLGMSKRFHVINSGIEKFKSDCKYDCIVMNPPYVPRVDLDSLQPEVKFESLLALDGGLDGSEVPKAFLRSAEKFLRVGGDLFMELHASHDSNTVQRWLTSMKLDIILASSYKDFAGIERFHKLTRVR